MCIAFGRGEATRSEDLGSDTRSGRTFASPGVMAREPERPGWGYYAAVAVFLAILAFAVLGLVRSSSLAGASTRDRSGGPTVTPRPAGLLLTGPIPTPRIPPPTQSSPTEPPSRTFIHPPPETAPPALEAPANQPLR